MKNGFRITLMILCVLNIVLAITNADVFVLFLSIGLLFVAVLPFLKNRGAT